MFSSFYRALFIFGSFGITIPASAMIGGTPTSSPSEVFLGGCTGTVISPNIILTAGHCTLTPNQNHELQFAYSKGQQILITSFDGSHYSQGKRAFLSTVKQVIPHPSWETSLRAMSSPSGDDVADLNAVSDVGVIIIEDQLPVIPAELPTARNDSQYLNPGRIFINGAGCQERGLEFSIGTLKTAFVPVTKIEDRKILVGTSDSITHSPAGLCKKDSGAGAFLASGEGSMTVLAVNSIMAGTIEDALGKNPTPAFLARIDSDDVLSWLRQVIIENPPSTHLLKNIEPQSLKEDVMSVQGTGTILIRAVKDKIVQSFLKDDFFKCLPLEEIEKLVQIYSQTPTAISFEDAIASLKRIRTKKCENTD